MRAHVRHSPLTTKGTEVLILDEAEERWNQARVAAVGKDAISVQARTPLLAQPAASRTHLPMRSSCGLLADALLVRARPQDHRAALDPEGRPDHGQG